MEEGILSLLDFWRKKKRRERESCRRRELGLERGLEKEQIFGNQRGRTKWRSLERNNKGMISTSFLFFLFSYSATLFSVYTWVLF